MEDIRKALEDFDDAAQCQGYYQSEGTQEESDEAEKSYMEMKKKLVDKIEALEKLAGVSVPVSAPVVARRRKINW